MNGIVGSLVIIINAIFVNNIVMSQFLGCCPFLGVSKKLDTAVSMGLAVTFVMALSSVITYLIQYCILVPLHIEYMQTIIFILVIASLVQLVEMVIQKMSPPLYNALGIYLPLITTNCGVLGVTMNNISDGLNYGDSLLTALGCGLGFFMAMVIFSGVRSRVEDAEPPKSFEGLPITLVSASIVSLSFFGFSGVLDRLFGG